MPTPIVALSSLIIHILNPCYHRNKNQHRVTKWWKCFSMLRRHVKKLIFELEDLERDEKFADGKETSYTIKSRERVEEHAEWLGGWIEERCYVAFSTVVADQQYANLGVMLMGALAEIRAIVQSLKPELEVEEEVDVEKSGELLENSEEFDFGEVVKREDISTARDAKPSGDECEVGDPNLTNTQKIRKNRKVNKEKKKRRKTDGL